MAVKELKIVVRLRRWAFWLLLPINFALFIFDKPLYYPAWCFSVKAA